MKALGKNPESATLFLSGKYWTNGDSTKESAKALGFAVMYKNGTDLTVAFPPLKA
jgi:hypothetical protein